MQVLLAIGRITDQWAKVERYIDYTIWFLADLTHRHGAAITSQIPSIHARFRILIALMKEREIPDAVIKKANQFSQRAEGIIKNAINMRIIRYTFMTMAAHLYITSKMIELSHSKKNKFQVPN